LEDGKVRTQEGGARTKKQLQSDEKGVSRERKRWRGNDGRSKRIEGDIQGITE